jgi:hypothetical protein
MEYVNSVISTSRFAPAALRPPLEVIVTVARKGSAIRADGTTCFGYAGTIEFPKSELLHFASPALAREANVIYALAFRRAQTIVAKIIGNDSGVSYILVTQKAGLEGRIETASIINSRDGYKANFSRADAIDVWTPIEKKHAIGHIRFREFKGLVKKAPIGFKNLMQQAIQQCEVARSWEFSAYKKYFGETFDRYDLADFTGPRELVE